MIWKTKRQFGTKLFLFVLLLVQLSGHAHAFPFEKASGVTELSPDTLLSFVNSHKPVVILFYASWCGHCRNFHAEYKKFADIVKGSILVGAIDAHTHSSIGQQFGVQGFPTIKYWKMGKKSVYAPDEYRGPRTAASLMSLMANDIRSDRVAQSVRTAAGILGLVQKSPSGKVAVLFSSKQKVPPIFSVLSFSPRLMNMSFVFVHDDEAKIGSSFGISKIPSVAVIEKSPEGPEEGAADSGREDRALPVRTTVYPSKSFAYEALARFFLSCLEKDGRAPAPRGPANGTSAGRALSEVERPPRPLSHSPSPTSVELFTAKTLEDYCSANASRIMGYVPWCVIGLNPELDLDHVRTFFLHEPLLFFDASKRMDKLREALGTVSSSVREEVFQKPDNGGEGSTILLWRQTKLGTARYKVFSDIKNANELNSLLQRLLNGDLRLQKEEVPF